MMSGDNRSTGCAATWKFCRKPPPNTARNAARTWSREILAKGRKFNNEIRRPSPSKAMSSLENDTSSALNGTFFIVAIVTIAIVLVIVLAVIAANFSSLKGLSSG